MDFPETCENQPHGVGFLYDECMLVPHCVWVPTYPECPSRLKACIDRCHHYKLIERCVQIPTRVATEEEILLQHSKEYYDLVKSSASMSLDELKVLSEKFDAAYFHEGTYDAAMTAAGCTLEAIEQVVKGKVRHSLALVRPPGHHALRTESCGYCIFNNVAIAAKYAVEKLGLSRVLIVDWDLHHGQGTQYMFYDDPRVLYFSIHRYEHGSFWPCLRQSDYDFVGQGFNVNVPFNKTGMKDGDYMAIMQQILMPLAHQFDPELVIVSSGYDAAIGDAEGRSEVTPSAYAHFTSMMKGLANGKLCVIFEGGYCLKSLAEGLALTLKCLLGDPCPQLPPLTEPMESTKESIMQVIRVLRPFWKCFAFQDDANEDEELPEYFRNIVIPKEGIVFFDNQTRPDSFSLDGYESYSAEEESKCDQMIEEAIKNTLLHLPPNRTCIAYDDRMLLHKFGGSEKEGDEGDHPEKPSRAKRIVAKLKENGLFDRCKLVPSRIATDEEIGLIHTKEHIEEVKSYERLTAEELKQKENSLNSVYLSKNVFLCAALAAGCTLNVVDEVLSGNSLNGFAVVRPPGHHAHSNEAMGFCYFNNVAIAAKYAQQKHSIQKVLIIDWDVHHGNGTQHSFYNDPSVLYVSLHRGSGAYPIIEDKYAKDVGEGAGEGYNINIVWSKGGMADSEYLAAFQQVILPVAYEFAPDLVLVSAGYDAAFGDHLGGCRVTPAGFGQMTHLLSSLADGRIILVLEGGYNLSILPECVASCVSVLLNDIPPFVSLPSVDSAVQSISHTIDALQPYWKSLSYRVKMPSREKTLDWLQNLGHKTRLDDKQQQLVTGLESLHISGEVSSGASKGVLHRQDEACCAAGGKDVGEAKDLHQFLRNLAQGQDSLELHAVAPFLHCPHVDLIQPVPAIGLDTTQECVLCGAVGENWVCLCCYEVHCSRYQNGHMVEHNRWSKHPIALSYADMSAWCYSCDTYVDHVKLLEAKTKACEHKFH